MSRKKFLTSYPGVRYREHPTRKHGIKPDRYFFIRYKLDGKDKEEGVGWSSAEMTAEKANKLLADIRENIRRGKGPHSLAEQREQNEAQREAEAQAKEEESRKGVPFGQFFEQEYMPVAEARKKSGSIVAEKALYSKWLKPVLADVPLVKVDVNYVDRVMLNMTKEDKSPATIKYAVAIISQVWNFARDRGLVEKESPTRRIKKPKLDNKRVRFLTEDEAKGLLSALWERSLDVHDMTVFGIFCGARASEIFGLRWGDIDQDAGTVFLRKTKTNTARHVYLTKEVRAVLERRYDGQDRNELLFSSTKGEGKGRMSKTFDRTVAELGLNDGIADARQKVVFHTTRHTFASWLVQRGVPLYTVAKLTGHSELRMVERYAHLAPEGVKEAALLLEGAFDDNATATRTKKAKKSM